MGSLVRLSSGELAVVVGWSERTRRDMGRPVVSPLEDGKKLGRRIDLLWRTELKIEGTPSLTVGGTGPHAIAHRSGCGGRVGGSRCRSFLLQR